MKLKKILSLITLLGFVIVNTIPYANAVQLFGEDINYKTGLSIPPIVDDEGKSYYSINPSSSSGLSSLVCIQGEDEEGNRCKTYVGTVTPIFLIDLENFDKREEDEAYVLYRIGGSSLRIFAKMPKPGQDEEYIYFYYGAGVKETPLAKVSRNKKCGTTNQNACVIAFHFYMYFSALEGNEGAYLSHVDMIKYSDEEDNFLYYRDEKWKNEKTGLIGFFQSIQDFILNKPSYGKKLFNFSGTYSIFNARNLKDNKYFYFRLNKSTNLSYFQRVEGATSAANFSRGLRGYVLGMTNFDAYTDLKQNNTIIRDFLVGDNSGNLQGTLKEYFGAKGAISGIVNNKNGEVETDPNIYNDEKFNDCSTADIGCHIGNLSTTIKAGFVGITSKILDGIKSIFSWIWNNIKGYLEPFIKPIYDFIINIIEETKLAYEKTTKFFSDLFELVKKLFKDGNDPTKNASASQKFLCNKDLVVNNNTNIQDSDGILGLVFNTFKAGFGLFGLIDIIAPTNGTQLCTYDGIKTLHLRENSWVDIIFFLIFGSSLMLLFLKNS